MSAAIVYRAGCFAVGFLAGCAWSTYQVRCELFREARERGRLS